MSLKHLGRIMQKGPGRHDTWFRVICIWNLRQNKSKMAETLRYVHTRSDFYGFQLLFPDFYHFHHVIWGMKWAKKLKTKNGQNMSSGPFSHDAAHFVSVTNLIKWGDRGGLPEFSRTMYSIVDLTESSFISKFATPDLQSTNKYVKQEIDE